MGNIFSLKNKVALVTGASYGIGFSIAVALSEAGAKIVFNDINSDLVNKGLEEYKKIGIEAFGYVFDVTNEEDAEKVFGIKPKKFNAHSTGGHIESAAFRSVCEQMMERFPRARKIIITLRGSINANHNTWSGVLFNGKELFESKRYDITHIVDRVGGGDSFMGGLICGLLTYNNNDAMALEFAVAASCLKHTIYGDFNLVKISEVEALMGGDGSGRVIR
jgi:NAD(P)-dependent dehydrogenase (short-subunit alcohol dehydrogenase family)